MRPAIAPVGEAVLVFLASRIADDVGRYTFAIATEKIRGAAFLVATHLALAAALASAQLARNSDARIDAVARDANFSGQAAHPGTIQGHAAVIVVAHANAAPPRVTRIGLAGIFGHTFDNALGARWAEGIALLAGRDLRRHALPEQAIRFAIALPGFGVAGVAGDAAVAFGAGVQKATGRTAAAQAVLEHVGTIHTVAGALSGPTFGAALLVLAAGHAAARIANALTVDAELTRVALRIDAAVAGTLIGGGGWAGPVAHRNFLIFGKRLSLLLLAGHTHAVEANLAFRALEGFVA